MGMQPQGYIAFVRADGSRLLIHAHGFHAYCMKGSTNIVPDHAVSDDDYWPMAGIGEDEVLGAITKAEQGFYAEVVESDA